MKRELRTLQEILEGGDYTEPRELAKAMRVSLPTVYSWVRKNEIPCIKFGHLVRFDPLEIRAFIDARRGKRDEPAYL